MEWIELPPLESPADALAWEDLLLDEAEADPTAVPEGRFWYYENPTPCVVIGYGQKIDLEVNVIDCAALGIPIFRRCSGGGAVVLGPGCLAYGLILPIRDDGPLSSITGANQWIMERHRRAWTRLLGEPVVVRGHTDLAVVREGRERKFSGNAQRRRRRHLLFHGTALLGMDLALVARVLRTPSWAPDYRAGREHRDFLTNLNVTVAAAGRGLRDEWRLRPAGRRLDRGRIGPGLATLGGGLRRDG